MEEIDRKEKFENDKLAMGKYKITIIIIIIIITSFGRSECSSSPPTP